MNEALCCPNCGGRSFNLAVEGRQEKAEFDRSDDGTAQCLRAGAVHITWHDPEALRCRSCNEMTTEEKLEPAEG